MTLTLLLVGAMTNFAFMTEAKHPANGKHFSLHPAWHPPQANIIFRLSPGQGVGVVLAGGSLV